MRHNQTMLQGLQVDDNEKLINVSSVPQRSPFRYPGGKTWLIPRVRQWLSHQISRPPLLVEPFAGGGIVSLTAVAEGLVEKAIMVELDSDVSAVWRTILSDDCDWLVRKIGDFTPTFESVTALLETETAGTKETAFKTIVRNRTSHGGVLAPGSGLLKRGENNKGIASRWYGETIQKRIRAIHELKSRIDFVEGDGIAVMETFMHDETNVIFVDPPYTAPGKRAGHRLYVHWDVDHESIFRIASEGKADMLLTYDNEPGARELSQRFGLQKREVSMQNTHLAKMKELLIAKNLDWMPISN